MQNSKTSIFPLPYVDQEKGITKVEYATIEFVAAHLKAHGKYPDVQQVRALAELAIYVLDGVIPAAVAASYPDPVDEHQVDPEHGLSELEIDQPNSPFHNPTFTEE